MSCWWHLASCAGGAPKGSEHCSPMAKKPPHGKPPPLEDLLPRSKAVACDWEAEMEMASNPPQLISSRSIPVAQLSAQIPFHSPTHHHKHFNSKCSSGKESSAFSSVHSPSASDKDQNGTKSSANLLTQLAFWL